MNNLSGLYSTDFHFHYLYSQELRLPVNDSEGLSLTASNESFLSLISPGQVRNSNRVKAEQNVTLKFLILNVLC